ncbi:3-deoxy-7-phosphoheptulonate synthase [Bacteroidota bacterium]
MIIHLKEEVSFNAASELADAHQAVFFEKDGAYILVTTFKDKILPEEIEEYTDSFFVLESDIQLASSEYISGVRKVILGKNHIGGEQGNTIVMAGPCSVESEEQITASAELMVELGISVLRAGCFKPRTSPYSFQGMGIEGLRLLAKMREKYGLTIITEVRDASHIEEVIAYSDVIQIGAKSMYDHGILRRCGKADKPVLLKRGFGTTLQEFVQCAEFILSGGNPDVMLCERGIRTFETKTRFTLDLCGVSYLKEYTNLPVILDPSHAMGHRYGVPDLTRACTAMGIDGLLIEVHPDPSVAKSDASQQLDHEQFRDLYKSLGSIATSVGKRII